MLDWLRLLRLKRTAPLTGAPPVRRVKSHSAESGYVYQYVYQGRRETPGAIEYVFSVSADRTRWAPVSVFVAQAGIRHWLGAHDRELTGTELYAIAKIALRRAFDSRAEPPAMRDPVEVGAGELENIVAELGLE